MARQMRAPVDWFKAAVQHCINLLPYSTGVAICWPPKGNACVAYKIQSSACNCSDVCYFAMMITWDMKLALR